MSTRSELIKILENNLKCAKNSLEWIQKNSSFSQSFDELYDLLPEEGQKSKGTAKAFLHHFIILSDCIYKTFLEKEIYIGISLINDLILDGLRKNIHNFPQKIIETICDKKLHDYGFILTPLHNLKIATPFLTLPGKKRRDECFSFYDAGMAIIPPTCDTEKTIDLIDKARKSLGINREFTKSDIHHYLSHGTMDWFSRNPLLVFRINIYSNSPYENQNFISHRLRTITSLLLSSSLFCKDDEKACLSWHNGHNQTLDIHHYIHFEPSHSTDKLTVDRIPLSYKDAQLFDAFDANCTIPLKGWDEALKNNELNVLYDIFRSVEIGFLKNVVMEEDIIKADFYKKVALSIDYYRKSFQFDGRKSNQIISLAIAFETLLTDSYSGGVTSRIERRVKICLKSKNKCSSYMKEIKKLFDARGKFVHSGRGPTDMPIESCQKIYIYCLEFILDRAANNVFSKPVIENLINDKGAKKDLFYNINRIKKSFRELFVSIRDLFKIN
ncbi:hypothetical protein [Acetobacter sp.]|uniref:hypothetical protein n=1 Tax=Acetobacter sp. TaxID=440 RepID=UPI0039E8FA52